MRSRGLFATALAVTALTFGAVSASAQSSNGIGAGGKKSDVVGRGAGTAHRTTHDELTALVQLTSAPVSTAASVNRTRGNRVVLTGAKTIAYRAQLAEQRRQFKDWLRTNAPKVRVGRSFDIAVNAVSVRLNGTTLDALSKAPMVRSVQYVGLYRPLDETPVDPDLALVNAVTAWGGGGAAGAGAGVKVGIIDSGIDQDHACFDDMGDRDSNPFTNNKVIVAKVFHMQAIAAHYTPEAIDSHGTHVAGTVACDYGTTATVEGVTIPHTISGVAPAALLGNYNVFPGHEENARSEDILNALEAAYADGMHVVNMSLGGGFPGIQDLLTIAVDNLDRGGMVSAISAGNSGPGPVTVGSPGSASRGLTAGASEVPHLVSTRIQTSAGSAMAPAAEFSTVVPATYGPIDVIEGTGPTGVTELAGVSQACSSIPAGTGVAVIARGTCDFSLKVRNVEAAGYSAVIVINRVEGVFSMGSDGADDQPDIPAVMIDLADADVALTAEGDVQFFANAYYNPFGVANQMADFTSEGPTPVDYRVKPDLVAPGVNVLSSVPGGEFAFYNGTSMASPHLAGAAAVVLSQHPDWTAWQVRSAITNTANLSALVPYYDDDSATDPNLVGAGLLDVAAAVNAQAMLSPVSASFGTAQSGAGTSATRYVTLKNLTDGTLTARVVGTEGGATFSVSGSVGGNTSGVLTVTASTPKRATAGMSWATIEILSGDMVVAHMRVFVLIA